MTLTATRAFADRFEEAAKAAKNPQACRLADYERIDGAAEGRGTGAGAVAGFAEGHCDGGGPGGVGELSSKMLKHLLDTSSPRARTLPRSTSRTSRSRSPTLGASRR